MSSTTEVDVDRLEAGREMNKLVAARVMEWAEWADLSQDCPCEPGVTYFADWGDAHGVAVYEADDSSGDVAFYFNPSGDIADAWKLVDKLIADKPLKLQWCFWVPVWSAQFGEHIAYGLAAPLAISRAAYKLLTEGR